ncbi:hypothetical protein Tco_1482690 [Tanacetum coccineum]
MSSAEKIRATELLEEALKLERENGDLKKTIDALEQKYAQLKQDLDTLKQKNKELKLLTKQSQPSSDDVKDMQKMKEDFDKEFASLAEEDEEMGESN